MIWGRGPGGLGGRKMVSGIQLLILDSFLQETVLNWMCIGYVFHMLVLINSLPPLYCLSEICTKDKAEWKKWVIGNQSAELNVQNSLQGGTGSIRKILKTEEAKIENYGWNS